MKRNNKGFTLLEVLIAVSIMTIATVSILLSESNAINVSIKAKYLNTAVMLAKNMMVESEITFKGRAFSELPKEKEAVFEAPFKDYKWKREIKEVKFPSLQALGGGEGDKESENSSSKGSEPSAALIMSNITKFINESFREITITIFWEINGKEYKYTITSYLLDEKNQFKITL